MPRTGSRTRAACLVTRPGHAAAREACATPRPTAPCSPRRRANRSRVRSARVEEPASGGHQHRRLRCNARRQAGEQVPWRAGQRVGTVLGRAPLRRVRRRASRRVAAQAFEHGAGVERVPGLGAPVTGRATGTGLQNVNARQPGRRRVGAGRYDAVPPARQGGTRAGRGCTRRRPSRSTTRPAEEPADRRERESTRAGRR